MRYQSTRGRAPELDFEDAMLTGLARDGGLYLPACWPRFSTDEIAAFAGCSYERAAANVVHRYVGGAFDLDELEQMTDRAYAGFAHSARAPLTQIGDNDWMLELHHGPTLAFKDFAMQLIGRMFDASLSKRGERVCIVGATSGDTGSAAIEAFGGLDQVDLFILYPHGRVSEVQRRQMTTPAAPNVHAVAIEGDFDDCQSLVKAMFNDFAFRDRVRLAAVNSINWARVAAQIVYYFTSAVALGAPARKVSFAVPTGNFGDIFAGWAAKRMGLPIDRLIIATNENDILHRALETGVYSVTRVTATSSPSMDIQVSSNFERALFEAQDRDADAVTAMMGSLTQSGGFEIPPAALAALRAEYDSNRSSEAEVSATIDRTLRESGVLLDPHSAIGVDAARRRRGDPATPMIALGCAHAAKFPDAVEKACRVRPALPPHLANLYDRPERGRIAPAELPAIQTLIEKEMRA